MSANRIRITTLLAGLAILLSTSAAMAILELVEGSVEAVELELRVDRSLSGYASGAQCQECPRQRFKVTPKTIYMRNFQPVDPSQASSFSGKPGTIIFDLKSREVTRILQ